MYYLVFFVAVEPEAATGVPKFPLKKPNKIALYQFCKCAIFSQKIGPIFAVHY
jgi:hypothetical protein